MSFPSSVDRLDISRFRRRRADQPEPYSSDHKDQASPTPPSSRTANDLIGGPVVDVGRPGAARLVSRRGKREAWAWEWVNKYKTRRQYSLAHPSEMLFPPTRNPPVDSPPAPLNALLTSATQYALSLPDSGGDDGILEFVREETAKSYYESTQSSEDVFLGRRLALIHNLQARLARTLACFPIGELGQELCISPFLPKSNARSKGRALERHLPNQKPVFKFFMSILQIQSSDYVSMHRLDCNATALLVRLHSLTYLLRVVPNHTYTPPTQASPVSVAEIGRLSTSDTEGRRHVDAALDPKSWARVVVVDEGGGVWLWWEEKQRQEWDRKLRVTMQLRSLRGIVDSSTNSFYRVAFGTRPETILVVSLTEAVILDLETGQFFTSIEKGAYARGSTMTCMCTNKQVFWVDETRPYPVALRYEHGIPQSNRDRIEIFVLDTETEEVTFLSSSKRSSVLCFHIDQTSPIRLRRSPYLIAFAEPENQTDHFDFVAITRNKRARGPLVLIGLRPDGALMATTMSYNLRRITDYRLPTLKNPQGTRWKSTLLQEKGEDTSEWEEEAGVDKARTKSKTYNARWAWLKINERDPQEDVEFNSKVYKHHLQEMEAPINFFLTAADLARDATLSLPTDPRSTGLRLLPPFNTNEGGSLDDVISSTKGDNYFGYSSTIETGIMKENITSLKMFTALNRNESLHLPGGSSSREAAYLNQIRIHRENLSRLEADLRLATTIVHNDNLEEWRRGKKVDLSQSGDSITSAGLNTDDLVARATDLLTLADTDTAPRRVKISLHILHPNLEETAKGTATSIQTFTNIDTVNQLLGEWKLSEDPKSYQWRPPNDAGTGVIMESESKTAPPVSSESVLNVSQSTPRIIRSLPGSRHGAGSPNRRTSPSGSIKAKTSDPMLPYVRNFSNSQPPPISPRSVINTQHGMLSGSYGREWGTTNLNTSFPVPPSLGTLPSTQSQAYSQPMVGGGRRSDPSSPVSLPQTQIERGPHGGRLQGEGKQVKKKVVKKRLGGF